MEPILFSLCKNEYFITVQNPEREVDGEIDSVYVKERERESLCVRWCDRERERAKERQIAKHYEKIEKRG